MFVSVIVPHKSQEELLVRCIAALSHQSYPVSSWELLVVHNDSQPLALPIQFGNIQARVVWEPRPGPAAARNRGVRLARGEILALLDADCIPDKDWLRAGATFMGAHPHLGIGAGEIRRSIDLSAASAIALFDAVTYLQQRMYVERHRACVTANMFVRREICARAGDFDEDFSDNSYDDWDWVVRAVNAGAEVAFIENAIILHDCIESLTGLEHKVRRMCRGQIAFDRKHGRWRDEPFRFLSAFLGIYSERLRKLRSDRRLTTYQRTRLVVPALLASYWYASEMRRILGERKHSRSACDAQETQ